MTPLSRSQRLRDDDAGFFALQFLGFGKLAAEEFDVAAGARAAVGAQQAHAVEKNEKIEDVGVLEGGGVAVFGLLLLYFGDESGERGVKLAGKAGIGRLLVVDAAAESLVGFGEGLEAGEDVGVSGVALGGAEVCDRERKGGHKLLLRVDDIGGESDVEQGRAGWKHAGMLVFVAMGGDEVWAIGRAVDGDFAACSAADGADSLSLGGTEARAFSFFTYRAGHTASDTPRAKKQNTLRCSKKAK